MNPRTATALAVACGLGCLDFDQFQPGRDAGADLLDSTAPDRPEPTDSFDASAEPPPPDAPPSTASPTVRLPASPAARW